MNSKCLLVFVLLPLAACKPSAEKEKPEALVKIEGQVFVIRKDRVNVELGGVSVHYVSMNKFRDRCAWIAEQRGRAVEVAGYRDRLENVDVWLRGLERMNASGDLNPFIADANAVTGRAWRRYRKRPEISEFERISEFHNVNGDFFEGASFYGDGDAEWAVSCLFGDWLARSSYLQVDTDADGRFSFNLVEGALGCLICRSSRQLGKGKFENYYWVVEVDGSDSNSINLSSVNEIGALELHEFVQLAAEPNRSSQRLIENEMDLVNLDWFFTAKDLGASILSTENRTRGLEMQKSDLNERLIQIRLESEP